MLPYPGFAAYLGTITKVSTGETTFHPFGVERPLSPNSCVDVFESMYCVSPSEYVFRPTFCLADTPPLCSPEDYIDHSPSFEVRKKESSSSGYGSAGSESEDLISMHSDDIVLCRERFRSRTQREKDLFRRRSMPPTPSFRSFVDCRRSDVGDLVELLCADGHVNFETDVDTGEHIRANIRGMSRPESVLMLARKFGEISAAQQNDLHKSRQYLWDGKENSKKTLGIGLTSPVKTPATAARPIGGIASLTIKSEPKMAARPNMFKQMEKVGQGSVTAPPRALNPNSIKDALLRWVQNRVVGYPIEVRNFSSSWADGMAFCALIHRFAPQAFDFATLDPKNRRQNFELAFKVAEQNGIFPLLEVDDMIMMGDRPDWKCVFTYVQAFYKQFRDRP